MRKHTTFLSLALSLAAAANAFAISLGDTGTATNAIGAFQIGQGGEFYVQAAGASPGPVNNASYATVSKNQGGYLNSFQTFCLEHSENLGGTGLTYVVNDAAVGGGVNQHLPADIPFGDRLSAGTGWLYSQFALGTLSGYNFTGSVTARKTSANLLQQAIWALEDEVNDPVPVTSNIFFNAAVTFFTTSALAQANATTGQFGVWVLNFNVTGNNTVSGRRQDMLFFAGGASTNVPDGGSALTLLGMAMAGIYFISRKTKSPVGA